MDDLKKMTVERLRDLARKLLGPGHSRYKTKRELIQAIEAAGEKPSTARGRAAEPARSGEARAAGARVAGAARKAGKQAGKAARAVARAGRAAAEGAAEGAREAVKEVRGRKPGKVGAAVAAVAGAAAGAAAGVAAARRAGPGRRTAEERIDPEGYFVARVRGEEAAREAPHPMAETERDAWASYEEGVGAPSYEEQLGELPWSYGDDAFAALPRDPRTVFLYWDHARETLARSFEGLDHPRTQLWIFVRSGEGWERLRIADFALESRGYYVHDLEPGRTYRVEIHVVDRSGRERLLASASNEVTLPPVGPSSVVDDRFVRIPWEVPLGRLLGPGHVGGPFPEEARALLQRLSDWSRFAEGTWGGGSAGGMGGRPFSPTSAPSSPSGGGER